MKNNKVKELRGLIYTLYNTESEMAKELGWPRQRLNKITNGRKEPNVEEVRDIARALGKSIESIVNIFLPQ